LRRPSCLGAVVAAALALGAASPALAGERGGPTRREPAPAATDLIGLLEVRVEGVSDAAATMFAQQIAESLGIAGYKVASATRLREFLTTSPWNAACLVGDCLAVLKTHAGVDRVVEARMVSTGPSYHYVITLLDTGSGAVITQKADRCEVCTTEEAFAEAGLAVVGLLHGLDGEAGGRTTPAPRPGARADRTRSTTLRLGVALVTAAVVAGAASAILYSSDDDSAGAVAAGAAGAFAVAGVTSLGISFAF